MLAYQLAGRLTIRYFLARNKHLFVLLSVKKSILQHKKRGERKHEILLAPTTMQLAAHLGNMFLNSHK